MSLSVAQGTVTATAREIFHCRAEVCILSLHNHSGGAVYIGEAGVTTTTGYEIRNNGEFILTIYNEDKLFGVVSNGTATIDILHTQPNP
jgi:hypothetical protein